MYRLFININQTFYITLRGILCMAYNEPNLSGIKLFTWFQLSCLQQIPGLFQDFPGPPKRFPGLSPTMINYRQTTVTYSVYTE